jgi:hypothetical protein
MFRFTIRDVLWLTALVGMAAAWWMHARVLKTGYKRERNKLLFTLDAVQSPDFSRFRKTRRGYSTSRNVGVQINR